MWPQLFHILPLLGWLIIAFSVYWLLGTIKPRVDETKNLLNENKNFSLENFKIIVLNHDGRFVYSMNGEKLLPTADGNYLLTKPLLYFAGKNESAITLQAKTGTMDKSRENFQFNNQIEMTRVANQSKFEKPIYLHTELLRVSIKNNMVSTNERVIFTQTQNYLSADGMNYSYDKRILSLKGNVVAYFDK